jgi:CRISPR-associated protein Cmr1
VLFPLREERRAGIQDRQRHNATLLRGVEFELMIRYPKSDPELPRDIDAAVWAWVNFGGIGARTRRGCGALFCEDLAPTAGSAILNWYAAKRKECGLLAQRPPVLPWPLLVASPLVNAAEMSPTAAWDKAVSTMWRFRQAEGVGREPGSGTPGRSRWPEADSIRALLDRGNPAHRPSITIPDPEHKPAFPRAAFGLPIIFHLRDEPVPKVEVRPVEPGRLALTRMASPMILRPLAVGAGDSALPMILPLCAHGPSELRLVEREDHSETPLPRLICSKEIARPDLADYGPGQVTSPMQNRSANGSPLEAFLSFAGKQGFKP